MKSNKYKILVLSDLKEEAVHSLNYAAQLSNEIDANVELFYAKKAADVLQTENPLSAVRVINETCNNLDKQIKDLVTPICKENNIDIKTTFGFGNVKNEIKNCIKTSQPDMIILGDRKKKRFSVFGDQITSFVKKNYGGVILVATEKNALDANGKVSLDNLGLKNNLESYLAKGKEKLVTKS